jgi:hypothetical protein
MGSALAHKLQLSTPQAVPVQDTKAKIGEMTKALILPMPCYGISNKKITIFIN